MAFFNLTQLGPQNLFKTASTCRGDAPATPEAIRLPQATPEPEATKVEAGTYSIESERNPTLQRELESTGDRVRVTASGTAPSTSHIATYSSSCKAKAQHDGSYTKYTELLHKHQRSPQGPMDLYRHPLTTSQMYGWWMSHDQPHRQDWAQGPRHVHVNSEMTRFVDEMSQTNKEFTLY